MLRQPFVDVTLQTRPFEEIKNKIKKIHCFILYCMTNTACLPDKQVVNRFLKILSRKLNDIDYHFLYKVFGQMLIIEK